MVAPNEERRPGGGGAHEPMLAGDSSASSYTSPDEAASGGAPFASAGEAAWALLDAVRADRTTVTRRAAGFIGETAIDPAPLSPKQRQWLDTLLERAGLPPVGADDAS